MLMKLFWILSPCAISLYVFWLTIRSKILAAFNSFLFTSAFLSTSFFPNSFLMAWKINNSEHIKKVRKIKNILYYLYDKNLKLHL